MCDFYIYKIIDNGIIALLLSMAIFYWRAAMGVGAFLNARAVNKDREALNKFNQYVAYQTKYGESIVGKTINKNNIIEERYKRSIFIYYAIGMASVLFLIGLLVLSGYFNKGIIEGLIVAAVSLQFVVGIVFSIFFILLFKFAHLKRKIISNSDEGLQDMEEFLSEAIKTNKEKEG